MNILIIGAGAIGCLAGGKLAQAGHAVVFAGRPRFVETLRSRGLTLVDERGRHVIAGARAEPAVAHALSAAEQPFDLAVLTVKSYDTAAAAQELANAASALGASPPPVLSLQNGVGNEETLAATLPSPILAGVITTPVSVPAPAVIQVDRPSYSVGLSPWRTGADGSLLGQTHDALAGAGFHVRDYPRAQGLKWTKLLMNMMGNALSAILDATPAEIFREARLADLELDAWREALRVMARAGIPPVNLGSYPFAWLGPIIKVAPRAWLRPILAAQVGKARGTKLPSLHADLQGDTPRTRSEIDWLNGAVAAKGAEVGVATPVNQFLTATFHTLMAEPERRLRYRGNPQQLLKELGEIKPGQE